jgi:hypothetical protein
MIPRDPTDISLFLPDDAATEALARWFAPRLVAGDCIVLDGPIGAGKSHFARALIRTRLARPDEDVPSPTFTLVQVYQADGVEIWHADLYRLGHPDEAWELGLEQAFQSAITLIEWPERLGNMTPKNAIHLSLRAEGEGRRATVTAPERPDLMTGLRQMVQAGNRRALSDRFLDRAGWGAAKRAFLAGDASDRSYDRLALPGKTAVLMDAPPGKGDDPAQFLTIARHLTGLGLSAPQCLADDLHNGFLLLEDLGDGLFTRLIADDPAQEVPLYQAATDVLLHLQSQPAPPDLPNLSAADWAEAAAFALDWYRFAITGDRVPTDDFQTILADLLHCYADGPRVLILRDYHAQNLLWLPTRQGLARVGLLDFQLAQMGQPGYDLVSLLQDARRDVPLETEGQMIRRFAAKAGVEEARFRRAYAILGAQRALRILGIFARLCLVAGKPGYLPLLPRVWRQLQANLRQPGLERLQDLCNILLPPPDPAALDVMEAKCGLFR